MKKILLSAFACEPGKGSEQGNGWNWAIGLVAKGYEVHCLTRTVNQPAIETVPKIKNLHFHYVTMPLGTEALYLMTQASIYLHYMLWQYLAYRRGLSLQRKIDFLVVHHVTWGSLQMGSFLYKLKAPFIFGPAGGGQSAPEHFKQYFMNHWEIEKKREKVSELLIKYNPACKKMLRKAYLVLASNPDTLNLAARIGAKNCKFSLDAALPDGFFPQEVQIKSPGEGHLKLLWVGRFMPRKGVLLILDVMQKLKAMPQITLTIVGHGEMESDIKAKIIEYDLQNTVTMTGKVPYEEVRNYYESHDLFFFTSLRDSCPAQVIEAMAFGMPVVTLDLHGQAILVNDKNGVKCKAEDPGMTILMLKETIVNLYNNPWKIREMSVEAYKFAKKQTWTEKIGNIVDEYYPQ
jgi:glycosyltransferase involved in cell wall biosynthesis